MPSSSTMRAIICRIDAASPRSRAVSSGLNQLKQALALLETTCSGISMAKPYCLARVDQPAPLLQMLGNEREHAQAAGIGSEIADFDQRALDFRTQAEPELGQSAKTVELGQASQKVDIVGKRHRQLHHARIVNSQHDKIVAAPQNKKTVCCLSPETAPMKPIC